MFKGETTHDFGTVARGAKEEHVFEFQNIYKEDIHIAGVRASCGCATPSITKQSLKTWEKGGIRVKFNTHSFLGHRSATITVTIDRPYYAEVQLSIKGHIRGDVVFDPGLVSFGSLDQGQTAERLVNVSYAGRSDWRIEDVRSTNSNLEVELNETQRFSGRVGYQLKVRIKPSAETGFFKDQMILVTNDYNSRQIPLLVEGNILSALQVNPTSLSLGVVNPGDTVTRNIVVRGKKPFRITNVKAEGNAFELKVPESEKTLHLVPVTFTANDEPGKKVVERIQIETDLNSGTVGSITATATIREKPESE